MPPPLARRIALVTGASRGIGYAAALALANAGAHIVAVGRTVGGLEELDDAIKGGGGSATLVPLDLKDYDGIDRLGLALHERFGRLDMLIGNAGILGPLSPLGHVESKAWHEVMGMQTQMVDVQAGKTTTVEFTFAPTPKPAASAPIRELTVPSQGALIALR